MIRKLIIFLLPLGGMSLVSQKNRISFVLSYFSQKKYKSQLFFFL
uniref:Uncharacterized protein n=1 Tax=Rhizophora mucronata TaxID=61149 RepID=A0A2P2QKA1_RHIMU